MEHTVELGAGLVMNIFEKQSYRLAVIVNLTKFFPLFVGHR